MTSVDLSPARDVVAPRDAPQKAAGNKVIDADLEIVGQRRGPTA